MNDDKSDKLDELRTQSDIARNRYYRITAARSTEEQDEYSLIRKRLAEKYGAEEEAARQEFNAAEKELRDEVERRAIENAKPAFPVGTKVAEWRDDTSLYCSWKNNHKPQWMLTGTKGIVEVVTKGSEFPSNMRWHRPSVGAVIVRLCKKNGTLGLMFDNISSTGNNGCNFQWLPEGVEPAKPQAAPAKPQAAKESDSDENQSL